MRWLWLLVLLMAGIFATAYWPRSESARSRRRAPVIDEQPPKPLVSPLLVAFDSAGRRLSPAITKEDDLYVIRCAGYVTEAYMPRPGDARPVRVTLTPGVTLRGRVFLGSREHPLEGARVECYDWPGNREARTGKDGRFEIRDLNPARHQFPYVTLAGILPPSLSWWPRKGELEIVLGEGATLRGKVVDTHNRPVAGARVTLLGHDVHMASCEGDSFAVVSRRDGAFTFHGLGGKDYWVVASNRTRKGHVEIPSTGEQEEEDRTCLVVVQERPRVRVRVIDPDGVRIEDARVLLMSGEPDSLPFPWWPWARREGGTYLSRPLDFGVCTVIVASPGWSPQSRDVALDRAGEHEIEFRLKDAHTMRGRIVDDTGRPIVGATVSLGESDEKTGAAGRFALRGLPAEIFTLDIACEGHNPVEVALAPTTGEHRIVMPRAATLIGRFEPVPPDRRVNARIFVDEFDLAGERVDLFGRFALSGLRSGTPFDITIEVEGWVGIPFRSIKLGPGEVRDLGVLRPPSGATLEGIVRDSYGKFVDGARISLESPLQEVSEWTITHAPGAFRFRSLAAVKAELAVYGPGLVTRRFDVQLGGRQTLDIVVARSGILTGTAKGAAELRLVPKEGGQPLRWTPKKGGSFSVNPAPGSYRLQYRVGEEWIAAGFVDVAEGMATQVDVVMAGR